MNIALTMDYGVVTNDIYSPIEEVFDNVLKVSPSEEFPDFPTDAEVIFDLGGYIEARSITVLRNSKVVLVPTINEYSILQTTINSVAEIEEYNTNICLIANRTKRGDYEEIRQILSRFYKYPIFEVKESQSIPAIFKKKKSIKAMVEEGGLQKYHFQYLDRQFDKIIEFIRRIRMARVGIRIVASPTKGETDSLSPATPIAFTALTWQSAPCWKSLS